MVKKNEYERLMMSGDAYGIPVASENMTIYNGRDESIMICTALMEESRWSYGYDIQFKNGRRAERRPGDLSGWFTSRNNAKLYFLGYVMSYREYFSEECIHAVKKQILKIIEPSLFINNQ